MLLKNRRRKRKRGRGVKSGGGRRGKEGERSRTSLTLTLRKRVRIPGTASVDWQSWNKCWAERWKQSCQWLVSEQSTPSWVLSNLSRSLISTLDWVMGFGAIKSHLHSLEGYCSLNKHLCPNHRDELHSSSKYLLPLPAGKPFPGEKSYLLFLWC